MQDTLGAVSANTGGLASSWAAKADAGKPYGIDTVEYILFDIALDMAREDGSLKQDEVVAALEKMPWLTKKERGYLFGRSIRRTRIIRGGSSVSLAFPLAKCLVLRCIRGAGNGTERAEFGA